LATCCALLLREHDVGLDVALSAIRILAVLAEGEQTSWRDLARLREKPLSASLAGCDEHLTQQLHTIAEVLQFPKAVSLLLQQQLAVFRLRRDAADGRSSTATLVRAEAVLAPLLEQAEGIVDTHFDPNMYWPSFLTLRKMPAFWRGFFGDSDDLESMDSGRRELDHIAYGAGRVFAGRGLLPDLLPMPAPSCATYVYALAIAAAAVGDVATLAALHYAGRIVAPADALRAAAQAGQAEVIRLALDLGWTVSVCECLQAAAEADLSSEMRLRVLSVFQDLDPTSLGEVLYTLARCGDVQCAQQLLWLCRFDERLLAAAVERAAAGGHIPFMKLLCENGASLTPWAFQSSANVAVLQWCVERGCTLDSEFVRAAAHAGRLFQLDWAASVMDVSGLLTSEYMAAVASFGRMSVMEWLRARGCPWDSRVLTEARGEHRAGCVAFALRHGCPLGAFGSSQLCDLSLDGLKAAVQALRDSGRGEAVNLAELSRGAARVGNVEIAEWLVCDLGFPIAADQCAKWGYCTLGYAAAAGGCLRLLQHLHSKGLHTLCPADMRAARMRFHQIGTPRGERSIEIVRWLHAQDVPTHGHVLRFESFDPWPHQPAVDATDFLTFGAAREGALGLLQVLVEDCGAHWTESACVAAADNGRIDVLRWAIGKHCPCAADTWCAAVRLGGTQNDYRSLALLHSAKRPWSEAVWAAAAPYAEVQAWLKERGCPGSQAAPAAGAGAGATGAAPVSAVAVA